VAAEVKLTRRGQEVAELVALGLSNREIGQRLFLSERTIEWHVEQILNRLGFTSRSQIAAWVGRTQTGTIVRVPRSTREGNLPAPLTSIVGRDRELARLKELVAANRLVTVTGAGGTGKTRVALTLAAELEPAYPNGAWLCELASLADPALVGDAVAQALGVVSEERADRLAPVLKHLREGTALLVLDNCEHVLEAASETAQRLLGACPGLRLVATSRAPLGIPGEAVWRLEPLAEEAAIQLFTQRAQAATAGFELSGANAKAVTTICQRLDGIPLALELAAPRLRVLSVEKLAEVILDPAWQSHSAGRHASLEAVANWSYHLLAPEEQAFFRRLGVFAGRFDVEDAARVAPAAAEAPVLLAGLVEKSMVVAQRQPDGATHYRLLEMLRVFARERLASSGELDDARLAHAELMVRVAERASLDYEEGHVWVRTKFASMVDDMRAALRTLLELRPSRAAWLATALIYLWQFSGRISEGLRWTTAALEANPGPTQERSWLLLAYACLLVDADRREEAEQRFLEAVSIAGSAGDPGMSSELPFPPAVVAMLLGDFAGSEEARRRAVEEFTRRGDLRRSALFLNSLAATLIYQGRLQEARELAERSVEIRRSESVRYHNALDTLAQAHALLGDAEQARACWLEATPLAMQEGVAIYTIKCLEGLAFVAGMRGKKQTALLLHHCAEHLLAEVDIRYTEPLAPKLRDLMARLHKEVGPELAARLRVEGEALTPTDALELAAADG
jgi:predicted ATPase/DNA-binding CsgD family transcriptional regulator